MLSDIVGTNRMPLEDSSIVWGSGWRGLGNERVDELKDIFKQGQYGSTTPTIPIALFDLDTKQPLTSTQDGCTRLNNGKAATAALTALQQ